MKYIDVNLLRKNIDNWKKALANAIGEYSDGIRFALEHSSFVIDSLQQEQHFLPSNIDEAAIDFADNARKQVYSKDYAISSIADYDHGCIDGFKAGVDWAMQQLKVK